MNYEYDSSIPDGEVKFERQGKRKKPHQVTTNFLIF